MEYSGVRRDEAMWSGAGREKGGGRKECGLWSGMGSVTVLSSPTTDLSSIGAIAKHTEQHNTLKCIKQRSVYTLTKLKDFFPERCAVRGSIENTRKMP